MRCAGQRKKGYDKWQDLAQSIYELIDYSPTMRDDVTVVFVARRRQTMMKTDICLRGSRHPKKAGQDHAGKQVFDSASEQMRGRTVCI